MKGNNHQKFLKKNQHTCLLIFKENPACIIYELGRNNQFHLCQNEDSSNQAIVFDEMNSRIILDDGKKKMSANSLLSPVKPYQQQVQGSKIPSHHECKQLYEQDIASLPQPHWGSDLHWIQSLEIMQGIKVIEYNIPVAPNNLVYPSIRTRTIIKTSHFADIWSFKGRHQYITDAHAQTRGIIAIFQIVGALEQSSRHY